MKKKILEINCCDQCFHKEAFSGNSRVCGLALQGEETLYIMLSDIHPQCPLKNSPEMSLEQLIESEKDRMRRKHGRQETIKPIRRNLSKGFF